MNSPTPVTIPVAPTAAVFTKVKVAGTLNVAVDALRMVSETVFGAAFVAETKS